MRGFQYKKTVQALVFFTDERGEQNKMKALKLIWLADRLHLRKYARTITGDIYFALPKGPVASTTRDILERYGLGSTEEEYVDQYLDVQTDKYTYRALEKLDENVFSISDLDVMTKIKESYFHLNPFDLSDASHEFPEWKQYKSAFDKGLITRERIDTLDLFLDFEDSSHLFVGDDELTSATKELFIQNNKVLSFM